MTIVERVEATLRAYLSNNYRYPAKLYVGGTEATELDRWFGGIIFKFLDMEIVEVYRDSYLEVGV